LALTHPQVERLTVEAIDLRLMTPSPLVVRAGMSAAIDVYADFAACNGNTSSLNLTWCAHRHRMHNRNAVLILSVE
jgi:hypothetical protein